MYAEFRLSYISHSGVSSRVFFRIRFRVQQKVTAASMEMK